MGFSGSRVADKQDVFSFVEVLSPQKLPDQRFVNRGLCAELIGIDGFNYGEVGLFNASFGSAFLPVQDLPLSQAQKIDRKIRSIFPAHSGNPCVFSEHGGQLQFLEIVLQKQGGFVFFRQEAPPSESSVL